MGSQAPPSLNPIISPALTKAKSSPVHTSAPNPKVGCSIAPGNTVLDTPLSTLPPMHCSLPPSQRTESIPGAIDRLDLPPDALLNTRGNGGGGGGLLIRCGKCGVSIRLPDVPHQIQGPPALPPPPPCALHAPHLIPCALPPPNFPPPNFPLAN